MESDLIACLPLEKWGFDRYGRDFYYTGSEIGGVRLNTGEEVEKMIAFFSDCIPSQEVYYEKTKKFLEKMTENSVEDEITLPFMFKNVLMRCASVSTVSDMLSSAMKGRGLFKGFQGADNSGYSIRELTEAFGCIESTHLMNVYILWMEEFCAGVE